jgi:hypothetical protein
MKSFSVKSPFKGLLLGALWLVGLGCVTWAFGALRYDLPVFQATGAAVFAGLVMVTAIVAKGAWRKVGGLLFWFVLVLVWWRSLKPTNQANWQPDVAQTPWAEIKGDTVTLHNVRNCDYRSETDYTPGWETRVVRLSQMTGIDLALTYWGAPYMAHPIASFQFADAAPVCFSIETRKKEGQAYSALGGLYRQFELIYLAGDERDLIRVRTNFRKGEEVYLYHTSASPEQARQRFLEYLGALNELHSTPRWYNALTTNCTTNIRSQRPAAGRLPWDWRLLVNGKGDELMYERGLLATAGLPFPDLKKKVLINPAAQAAGDSPEFSKLIRAGRPGF